jgi:hypothetical protein
MSSKKEKTITYLNIHKQNKNHFRPRLFDLCSEDEAERFCPDGILSSEELDVSLLLSISFCCILFG